MVQTIVAVPFTSVMEVGALRLPPPDATVQPIVAPGIGNPPASVNRAWSVRWVLTGALPALPLTGLSANGGPRMKAGAFGLPPSSSSS